MSHKITFSTGNTANYSPGISEPIDFEKPPCVIDLLEFLTEAGRRQMVEFCEDGRYAEVEETCQIVQLLEGWEPDS